MADPIKDAFAKVKEDMQNLQTQLNNLTMEIVQLKRTLDAKIRTDRHLDAQTDRQICKLPRQTTLSRQTIRQLHRK